ncbi:hypothetical protein [Natronorubrum daqingense]|uniref:Uncharacterized protein n=1 Tax=Natronorubrum daqingense TaxID=588898 RepID=A0A1N7G4Y0_9EURY|nr:hypothetical protein [Natronorubrum daqingense]APX98726.1 hypothetical protein BB347_18650 [Natronorubrum daqingense]SIS07657.1 hypothetical protein SAMN05421809_3729 [Natronorubrum daqingense]
MSTTGDPFDYDHDLETLEEPTIEHTHIKRDDWPDELALFDPSANQGELRNWIVAEGTESFVSLESMR